MKVISIYFRGGFLMAVVHTFVGVVVGFFLGFMIAVILESWGDKNDKQE